MLYQYCATMRPASEHMKEPDLVINVIRRDDLLLRFRRKSQRARLWTREQNLWKEEITEHRKAATMGYNRNRLFYIKRTNKKRNQTEKIEKMIAKLKPQFQIPPSHRIEIKFHYFSMPEDSKRNKNREGKRENEMIWVWCHISLRKGSKRRSNESFGRVRF